LKTQDQKKPTSPRNIKKYYIEEERYDWVKVVGTFAGLESIYHLIRQKLMQRLIRQHSREGRHLDIGCGTGLVLCCMPAHTVGLDINRWALERAKVHAPKTQLILADADHLPFRRNVFSTITFFEVLEHMDNPKHVLREICRILETSGILIGSVPRESPFWKLRILSSTCPRNEPFHNLYKKPELHQIFNPLARMRHHFSIWLPNFFFTAEIDEQPISDQT
jgi:ubiquinone/menaquinone biosynthesis C-methylase UbiE